MSVQEEVYIHTDGGARGNPGPAGIGVVVYDVDKKILTEYGEYIGETTNNVAEYRAALKGLQIAQTMKAKKVQLFLDSELVVKQLNREYKVKNKDLGALFIQVYNIMQSFSQVKVIHVRRELNKEADRLVNEALDKAGK